LLEQKLVQAYIHPRIYAGTSNGAHAVNLRGPMLGVVCHDDPSGFVKHGCPRAALIRPGIDRVKCTGRRPIGSIHIEMFGTKKFMDGGCVVLEIHHTIAIAIALGELPNVTCGPRGRIHVGYDCDSQDELRDRKACSGCEHNPRR
jgi:hypothetical protein